MAPLPPAPDRPARGGFTCDADAAAYGAGPLRALGLVGNSISGVAGGVDSTKLQRMIDITRPVLAAARTPVRGGLTPSDVATADYLDPAISLPAGLRSAGSGCRSGSAS